MMQLPKEALLPGGATHRFWTPTTPPTNCWPEAPWGGGGGGGGGGIGGGGGGSRRGDGGGGIGGAMGGGIREGRLGEGVQVGRFGVLGGGGHRIPLPPLALPLTIASP